MTTHDTTTRLAAALAAHWVDLGDRPTIDELHAVGIDTDGVTLADLTAAGIDLAGAGLADLTAAGIDLDGVTLADLTAAGIDLTGVTLDDLTAVDLVSAGLDLTGHTLDDLDRAELDLRGDTIDELAQAGIDLRGTALADLTDRGVDLRGAAIGHLIAAGLDLRYETLDDLIAAGIDLAGATHAAHAAGVDLRGPDTPSIPDIHRVVRDAVGAEGERLDMRHWHSDCGTVHCIAGWVVHLAGEAGEAEVARQEGHIDWAAAAIYQASDPELTELPPMDAYTSRAEALAALEALAEG